MVRKISFQAKSYLFNLHEMFKNSGSELFVFWDKADITGALVRDQGLVFNNKIT
jgi:hypothetical protein